jgi:hypothetical protein
MPEEITPADLELVDELRRRQLLTEFDKAQRAVAALEAQLALVKKARADVIEQMRILAGDT